MTRIIYIDQRRAADWSKAMARSTRQDTEKHREQIVEAAARLFRARGLDGVSIPELMAEADMTHGGFYRHFASKDALAALGYAAAFEDLLGVFEGIVAQHKDDPSAARIAYIDTYLAKSHRDKSEMGCPTAALCTDVARGDTKSELHAAFVAGARRFADRLAALEPAGETSKARRQHALATLSTLVGAVLLSRATKGDAISDAILAAAKNSLTA
jgi:TetR/AcrR family transcriptional regulator, transcriptional repressor for nem operon